MPIPRIVSWTPVALGALLLACSCSAPEKCKLASECGANASCVDGVCKACPACSQSEVCLKAQCLPAACGDHPCGPGRACVQGVCADADCVGVTCPSGETCAKGLCYPTDCPDQVCQSGELCWEGACRTSQCQGVQCAGGETCANGQCLSQSCAGVVCAQGAACLNGACRDVRCIGVVCSDGLICADGRCVPQSCGGLACADGFGCVGGQCVDAQCEGVLCSLGTTCSRGACVACTGAACPGLDAGEPADASAPPDAGAPSADASVAPDAAALPDAGSVDASAAPDAGAPIDAGPPCGGGCDPGLVCVSGVCQSGCSVSSAFFPAGATDPSDPCKACLPLVSTSAFSPLANGASCGRGSICNADSCVSGCLINSTFHPAGQADPATSCRTCQPLRSTSWWSSVPEGTSCGAGVVCILGVCENGCWIDSASGPAFYPPWAPHPASPCEDCEPWISATAWTVSANDGWRCGSGKVCRGGSCLAGCWIGGVYYPDSAPNPGDPCQACEPLLSTDAWSSAPNGTSCGSGLACTFGVCQGACTLVDLVDPQVSSTALGSRVVARGSDGTLWTAFLKPDLDGHDQVFAAYSFDGGATWTPEQVSSALLQSQGPPSIAIDSSDDLHVVWSGAGWGTNPTGVNVQYRRRTAAGGWDSQVGLTDQAGVRDVPAIAVDSRDDVHVVWTSDDLSLSHRRGKAPCALADWDPVERPFVGSQAQSSAALAIDAGDHLHVAWAGRGYGANPGVSNIQYLGRVGAIWSSREPVTDLPGAQAAPSIAVDRAGHVHLAWAGLGWGTHAASINIQHGVRTAANAWAIDGVTDQPTDQSGPSLALDAGDNAYVSWLGDLGAALITTQFSQRQAGAWLPPVILEPLGTGRSATLSWASHPVVGGQRTNVPAIGCVCAYSFVATGPAVPVLNFYGDCGGPHG